MKKYLPAILLSFLLIFDCFSQEDPVNKNINSISEPAVSAQLDFLASDWMEGRETGEKGIELAADYIASMFQVYGLKPGINKKKQYGKADVYKSRPLDNDSLSYFQEFALIKYEDTDDHFLSVITEKGKDRKIISFNYNTDFTFQQKPLMEEGIIILV